MLFSKFDVTRIGKEKFESVKKAVARKKYDGAARKDASEGWSLTDIITQARASSSAHMAAVLISGYNLAGKKTNGNPVVNTINVKLKVVSRQACYKDEDGKILQKDPTRNDFVLNGELPQEGDTVRVKTGSKLYDEYSGDALNVWQRNALINSGDSVYEYEEFEVDENGCITLPMPLAWTLLKTNGVRVKSPQFGKAHSTLAKKDPDLAEKRIITNWLYEEVSEDYLSPENAAKAEAEAKKKAEAKAKREAKKAEEAKAQEEATDKADK